jgi:hypothetical protein
MQTHPRTIGKIKVHFSWKNFEISSKQRVLVKKKAWPAPVRLALSPNIMQEITFDF